MHAMGARHQRGQRVGHRQTAVAVAVPIHANLLPGGLYHFVHYALDQRERTHGRGMAAGIANHDGAGAMADGSGVEALNHLRLAATGVLGDVHDFQAERDRVLHRFFRSLEKELVRPAFGVAANGAGADESGGRNGQTYALGNFGDGTNVVLVGAGGTVGLDFQPRVSDLARQGLYVLAGPGAGTGQAQVEHVDAEVLHEVEDADLFGDRRIAHRGRLQAVAQRSEEHTD